MADNFYLIGCPRSRTAWLSQLLTFGDSVCHHELLSGFGINLAHRLKGPQRYIGSVDTNPLLYKDRPGQLVVIRRKPQDTINSILNNFDRPAFADPHEYPTQVENAVNLYNQRLNAIKKPHLTIDFETMDQQLITLCNYVAPGAIPSHHIEKMLRVKVTVTNRNLDSQILAGLKQQGIA